MAFSIGLKEIALDSLLYSSFRREYNRESVVEGDSEIEGRIERERECSMANKIKENGGGIWEERSENEGKREDIY